MGAEPVASQVVARDRLGALLGAFAVLGGTMERVALDVRLGQRTECGELLEPFASGQKGSSSMPHKRNPILCERIAGLARLLRGYAVVGFENAPLWEERDISHSSAERVAVPDAFCAIYYMARTLRRVVEGLEVRADRMRANLESTGGLVFSQRLLLALVDAGMSRDDAYRRVQAHALAAVTGGDGFRARVAADPDLRARLGDELEACFALEPLARHWGELFERGLEAARHGGGERMAGTATVRR